jgi:succinate dehydrogenase/fumarate reductase flavoprotein subunit
MKSNLPDIVTTDVLVIGAGIAGMFAALQAREHGADVILVNKGIIGSDGASTWMAGPGFQVALYPPDSPEVHAKDTIKAGRFIGDQQVIFECTRYTI